MKGFRDIGLVVLASAVVIALAINFFKQNRLAPRRHSSDTDAAVPAVDHHHPFTNRLVKEKSPYLLQHAHNPVDWYPWGAEAFAKARRENKPIFLSVGYSTCHWCHVMERESFENPEIARILNEHFVALKVDREERPDVDRVYMAFVQTSTGHGGWPMTVWLTPELKPFLGGTYFPPDDRPGLTSFPKLLTQIADNWRTNRAQILTQANQIIGLLQQQTMSAAGGTNTLEGNLLSAAFVEFANRFDAREGGFGRAPKFPRPVTLNFLLRFAARADPETTSGKRALDMGLFTLKKMAGGGLHDHLGGGFHRYSVDGFWHVPHFEKMLYDQAQLAQAYLDAFQFTREPLYEQVARDVLRYVRRDLTDKSGGFYSAEDADSLVEAGKPERGEGAFYVWTRDEIEQVLGKSAAGIFNYHFGVETKGNAPEGSDPRDEFAGKNILIERRPLSQTAEKFMLSAAELQRVLAQSRQKLFDVRTRRPRPHRDDKIITAWNGLMISAYARAYQVLGDREYVDAAAHAAAFLQDQLYRPESGLLIRSYREGASAVHGFVDDYAFLIQGLLDLYEASFDIQWLKWAGELQAKQDELFWDPQAGGYFSESGRDPAILLRMKDDYDGAEPSPNSVAVLNLLRLSQMTGREKWRQQAEKTLLLFGESLKQSPVALPQMLLAVDFYLRKPKQIVLAGRPETGGTRTMLREIHRHFLPNKILLLADGGAGQEFLAKELEFIKSVRMINGKTTAYVCENYVCKLPTEDPAKLNQLLSGKN